MVKLAGDTADKVAQLRKQLETALAENDALRREIRGLRSSTNSSSLRRPSNQNPRTPHVKSQEFAVDPAAPISWRGKIKTRQLLSTVVATFIGTET